ncbi:MAG: class F sortase, partial [Phycisphaerales bacterium]
MTATPATSTALTAALACCLITGCATAPRGPVEAAPPAPAQPAGRAPAPTSPELAPRSFMTGH